MCRHITCYKNLGIFRRLIEAWRDSWCPTWLLILSTHNQWFRVPSVEWGFTFLNDWIFFLSQKGISKTLTHRRWILRTFATKRNWFKSRSVFFVMFQQFSHTEFWHCPDNFVSWLVLWQVFHFPAICNKIFILNSGNHNVFFIFLCYCIYIETRLSLYL